MLLLAVLVRNLSAQQMPNYNHLIVRPEIVNPAMSIGQKKFKAQALFRSQSQNETTIHASTLANFKSGTGIGVYFNRQDQTNLFTNTLIAVSAAQSLKIEDGYFAAGLAVNYFDTKLKNPIPAGTDSVYSGVNFGAGIQYFYKNITIGIALNNLFENNDLESKSYMWKQVGLTNALSTHFSYEIKASEKLSITPAAYFSFSPSRQFLFCPYVNTTINKMFILGLGYHTKQNLVFQGGVRIFDSLQLSYMLDYAFTPESNNRMLHELMLSFDLGGNSSGSRSKNISKPVSPRNF